MNGTIRPSAAHCLTLWQYSDKTLTAIHGALMDNPLSNKRGTWEHRRLGIVRDEMERRGISRKTKP
ncbi:MAG: hypothetical protein ACK528_05850 [Alphaproteobacteria bacterium]|jgi:hypothetical protein